MAFDQQVSLLFLIEVKGHLRYVEVVLWKRSKGGESDCNLTLDLQVVLCEQIIPIALALVNKIMSRNVCTLRYCNYCTMEYFQDGMSGMNGTCVFQQENNTLEVLLPPNYSILIISIDLWRHTTYFRSKHDKFNLFILCPTFLKNVN